MQKGRRNKKGNYEMRCPAHYGKGETSLFYSPESDAVKCMAGCSHEELLRAFGLPEQPKVIGLKMGGKPIGRTKTEEGGNETLEENEDVGHELPLEQELDVCMADVAPQEVEWLIEPYIPLGKLTIVEGDPDEGKSFAMLAIAAAITKGEGLPFGELAEPGNVLLLSAEDGRADTIRPRLDSLGADIRRVFAVTVPLVLNDKGFEQLEQLVKLREAKLVLFDPVFAYVGGQADINQDNKVRAITSRLADIAERYNCAIVALRHLPKAQQRSAKMAGMSSVAWTASARSVLLFGHDPEDEQTRGFVHTKHNLSAKGVAQGYRIEEVDGKPHFRWTGESDLTAEKILYSQNPNAAEKSELEKAEDFLFDCLQGGSMLQKEIERRGNKARISKATLRRAKTKLLVESGRPGSKSAWSWKLPEDTWPWEESEIQEHNSDVQTEWTTDEHVEFQGSNQAGTTLRPDIQA
jgi:RecA-family ATPase